MSNRLVTQKQVTKTIVLAPEGFKDRYEEGCKFVMRHQEDIGCIKVHAILDRVTKHAWALNFIRWALRHHKVFVDCKITDTPHTTHERIVGLAESGYAYATVSTLGPGGYDRLCTAVEAAKGSRLKILAVGELTTDGKKRSGEESFYYAQRNGEMAVNAGAHGVICGTIYPNRWFQSHADARYRKLLRFAPGVGLPGDQIAADDQPPRNTPHCILTAGATHVVLQRGIGEARNPASRLREYRNNIEDALAALALQKTYEGGILA